MDNGNFLGGVWKWKESLKTRTDNDKEMRINVQIIWNKSIEYTRRAESKPINRKSN